MPAHRISTPGGSATRAAWGSWRVPQESARARRTPARGRDPVRGHEPSAIGRRRASHAPRGPAKKKARSVGSGPGGRLRLLHAYAARPLPSGVRFLIATAHGVRLFIVSGPPKGINPNGLNIHLTE